MGIGKSAVAAWIADFAPSMGAAIAYYTVFSMAPLLIIVIAIAALVFGEQAAQQALLEQIRGMLGDQVASGIEMMLANDSAWLVQPLDTVFAKMDATTCDWWGLQATYEAAARLAQWDRESLER